MTIRRKYSEEHLEFIRKNVVNIEKNLQKLFNDKFGLNVSVSVIGNLKHKVGVKSGLIGGRFVKGQTSFNKGKKWKDFMSIEGQANSRKTTFKKGNVPANRTDIGKERTDKNGYTQVKVQDGKLNKNWQLKHRLIYEKCFGKIPDGCNVAFADGNKQNFDIDNLILVTKAEDVVMNKKKLFFDNAKLTKTGNLIAKIIVKSSKRRRN